MVMNFWYFFKSFLWRRSSMSRTSRIYYPGLGL